MPQYKEAYLQQHLDNFKFVDPECRDGRIREINQRTKRCNRCQGFDICKMHPHFWLYGQPVRLDENERLEEVEIPEEPREALPHDEAATEETHEAQAQDDNATEKKREALAQDDDRTEGTRDALPQEDDATEEA